MEEKISGEERKKFLKNLIRRLHDGEKPEELKAEFKRVIGTISPLEISKAEEELISEGMPSEEIHRLCDVHLAVMRDSLEEKPLAPSWHPVHILMEEHKAVLDFARKLGELARGMSGKKDYESAADDLEHIDHVVKHLQESESHYAREENVLFPYLEKHGVTQPPAMMWMEHDKIRGMKKSIVGIIESRKEMSIDDYAKRLQEEGTSLAEMLSSHFYKENNILFPTALKVIGDDEWKEVRREFDEIGYCCFTPEREAISGESKRVEIETAGHIIFETGSMSMEEVEAVFNSLPVDITFVDSNDEVRYFSKAKERIFTRTKAVIGRKVQQCHPKKSIHAVNQILDEFRSGKRDSAEFWIDLKGRKIYIRYYPVRNRDGDYLGCIEVTQDITDIKSLEGEKRLL